MMAGFPASYFCIKAFSETDQAEDLKKFDVPTLILQGDDDQIVPYQAASLKQAKLVTGAILKIYKGAPHGMCTTLKDDVNADLLAFIQSEAANPVPAQRSLFSPILAKPSATAGAAPRRQPLTARGRCR